MSECDAAETEQVCVSSASRCHETASYPADLSLVRAKGPFLWFADRPEPVIDLIQGYSTTVFGHCDDELTDCAARAMSTMDHVSGVTSAPRESLATLLADLTPAVDGRVYFVVGGAQIVSQAMRLGCRVTGRRRIRALHKAFHGYSAEGEQLSAVHNGALAAGVIDETRIDCVVAGSDEVFGLLESHRYGACAIEPMQGAADLIELPAPGYASFTKRAARRARRSSAMRCRWGSAAPEPSSQWNVMVSNRTW